LRILKKEDSTCRSRSHEVIIIEKTAPVFNRRVAGTSIADLSDSDRIDEGKHLRQLNNKDEVALAAFDFNLKKVQSVIKTEMSRHTRAKDQLLTYLRVYDNYSHSFSGRRVP